MSCLTSSKRSSSLSGACSTACSSLSMALSASPSASAAWASWASAWAANSVSLGKNLSKNAVIWPLGSAPIKPFTGCPLIISTQVGMLWMRKAWPSCGSASVSIFTSLNRPLYSASICSSRGPSTLQGPHQGAQKSTSTGVCMDASMTSVSKVAIPTLIMVCSAMGAWRRGDRSET